VIAYFAVKDGTRSNFPADSRVSGSVATLVRQPALPDREASSLRKPWQLTLARFLGDRWSVAALVIFLLVLVASFAGGAILGAIVGHNGDTPFPYGVDDTLAPVGFWTHVPKTLVSNINDYGQTLPPPKGQPTTLFVAGADGPLGRDELIRVLDGGRGSLEIGIGAVLISALIAVPLGCLAGFFGGFIDGIVSRLTETIMAFPLIFFLVFATVRLSPTLRPIGWGTYVPKGVFAVALMIGVFTSFYPLRLIRAQLFGLRNAEFVQSSHMVGASSLRIIRKDLFPHLVPTLLVWGAIAVATDILLEVGLSVIGVGVQASTPTWGSLLATTTGTIYTSGLPQTGHYTIWQTLLPTFGILIAVVALNQVSEGTRRALEPWARR
jgi:ABC-type dipeptide/oligopeptide/nickel transport system permease subunit